MAFCKFRLGEICKKIFPESLVEIKEYGWVGIWPYILDSNGDEVSNDRIAKELRLYKGVDKEEDSAIAATKRLSEFF